MATFVDSIQSDTKAESIPPLQKRSKLANDEQALILDETWAKQAFLVPVKRDSNGNPIRDGETGEAYPSLEDIDIRNRTFSSVHLKFTDTSLGGSYAVNAKPQYTRYADIRSPGRLPGREEVKIGSINGKIGLGRYYSEAIEDTQQLIHMRFGVAQHNSLTKFFTGFYNTGAGRLARTGRTSNFFNTVGKGIGLLAQIIIWPILAVQAVGFVARFFFDRPTSKFYYMKPTMAVYWGAVNSMVNKIAVGKGLFPLVLSKDKDQDINSAYSFDPEALARLHEIIPDIISKDGGYDIYAFASRAERYRIAADNKLYEENNGNESADSGFYGIVKRQGEEKINRPPGRSWSDMLANSLSGEGGGEGWLTSEGTTVNDDVNFFEGNIKRDTPTQEERLKGIDQKNSVDKPRGTFSKFWNYLKTELNDGTAFATFRVDYTGPVQESFSNSVRESDIQSKMNGISSAARSTTFSFAGGSNIGGALGSIVDGATSMIKDIATGIADSMAMSGLVQLRGGAFVDIPKHWDSSSANLPKSNYTIKLTSPYGNVISQMQNIYIPLSMLLAAALPLSTGKQSYTSPFLVELWDKGRHQTRLGMIDNLSISRGTSNLGFNRKGQAMAIDVSFSVVDMSSVMHMQIAKGWFSNDENGVFDEETVFSDYMNTLSSLGLHEQFHTLPKLRIRAARSLRNLQALTSPAAIAAVIKEDTPVGWLEVLFKGTRRN